MKRISCHFMDRIFCALILLAAFALPASARTISLADPDTSPDSNAKASCVAKRSGEEYWAIIVPSQEWASTHPECLPEVTMLCCVPLVDLPACDAGPGEIQIGTLTVYFGEEPQALYAVIARDGNVVTVLLEDL